MAPTTKTHCVKRLITALAGVAAMLGPIIDARAQSTFIPTVSESGVPGFDASTWFAIYGPRALPPKLAEQWNEAINRYLNTPQAKDYFRKNHMRPVGGTTASFAEYHKSETARWGKVIVSAGIKPQ